MEQMPDADEEPQNETTEAVGRDKGLVQGTNASESQNRQTRE